MSNLIRLEWFKLKNNRSFWLLSGLTLIFAVIYPFTYTSPDDMIDWVVNGHAFSSIIELNNSIFLKLAPAILAGFYISSEYSMGTIKNIIASGNSRSRIYWAKLLVFSVGAIILSLVVPIVMTGTISIAIGFSAFPPLMETIAILGLLILYAAAFASIMVAFSFIFTNSGITVAFLLLFFLFNRTILENFSAISPFIERVYQYSIIKLLFDIDKINNFDGGDWTIMGVVPILSFIFFGLFGSWLFHRKEIK